MFIPDFHDGLLAFILEYLTRFHVAGFSTEYGLISSGSKTCITNFPYLEFFLKLANLIGNFTSSELIFLPAYVCMQWINSKSQSIPN